MNINSKITNSVKSQLGNKLNGITSLISSAINQYESGTITKNPSTVLNLTRTSEGSNNPGYSLGTVNPNMTIKNSGGKVYAPPRVAMDCFVINMLNDDSISFACEPEEITDNNQNNFEAVDVRGRSSPYQGYSHSGPRTISFTLTLHQDLCPMGLLNTINHLKALTYPGYGGILEIPKCYVHIGYMISCLAIISEVGVSWKPPIRDHAYVQADVSLAFTEVRDDPLSYQEVIDNGQYI
jgi:hypothetical protein